MFSKGKKIEISKNIIQNIKDYPTFCFSFQFLATNFPTFPYELIIHT